MKRVSVVLAVMMMAGIAWGEAATKPATTQAVQENALFKKLNDLPAKLWPEAGENNSVKDSLRDKWVGGVKVQTLSFTGTVKSVDANGKNSVRAQLDCGKQYLWGKDLHVTVTAVLENVSPEKALDWDKSKTITIEATFPKNGAAVGNWGPWTTLSWPNSASFECTHAKLK